MAKLEICGRIIELYFVSMTPDNFHFLRNVDAVFLRRVDDRDRLRIPVGDNQVMLVILQIILHEIIRRAVLARNLQIAVEFQSFGRIRFLRPVDHLIDGIPVFPVLNDRDVALAAPLNTS